MKAIALLLVLMAVGTIAQVSSRQILAAKETAAQVMNTTYKVIIRTGDKRINSEGQELTFGGLLDKKGDPVLDDAGNPRIANVPDFTSYVENNKQLYLVSQMEDTPAAYYMLNLEQDRNGDLRAVGAEFVNTSAWEGSIRPCAGMVTPWGTHLGGEETYPDVREIERDLNANKVPAQSAREMLAWYGFYQANVTGDGVSFNTTSTATVLPTDAYIQKVKELYKPYMYGHVIEITITGGTPSFQKHFVFGRISFELSLLMPDLKTFYLSDDAGNSGAWYKFIADKKMDWSTGTLYAAKVTQTNEAGAAAGELDLDWIKMGHLNATTLERFAQRPLNDSTFSHIFLSEEPVNGSCPTAGFRRVSWESSPLECLKLNDTTPDVAQLAAGLETRRYVTYVGATSQFSKFEGASHDSDHNKIYVAISFQQGAMTANSTYDEVGNEIKLKPNRCGCVYAANIDSNYNARRLMPQVCGIETTVGNHTISCATSVPSNPDNVKYMTGYSWLLINEDASNREQDLWWAHNVVTKENILIGSAEAKAETTATWWHPNLGGRKYITGNYQGTDAGRGAPVGYMGPFNIKGNNITFKPHVAQGQNFFNPYSPRAK